MCVSASEWAINQINEEHYSGDCDYDNENNKGDHRYDGDDNDRTAVMSYNEETPTPSPKWWQMYH